MADVREILDIEEKYKKLLTAKLAKDERLSVSCPGFKYPEPLFVYVRCVKTGKSIAVRLDGGDRTMRFWDYVDDDYEEEDGVWANMTENGLDSFVRKLYAVMEKAVDIEYFGPDGECEEYFSGVANFDLTEQNVLRRVKKFAGKTAFAVVKVSNFFGDVQFAFDKNFKCIKR